MNKILIVEDEDALAQMISSYVLKLNLEITSVVDSGEAAVESVVKQHPDLALLDIQIHGGMDGFGVADVLRRQYDVPSIFLTSRSDDETLASVRESSAYGYLLKPFRPEELRAAIDLAFIRFAQETRWKQLEQSFSAAIHSTSDGVIITDSAGLVQFMNPAAERMTGWIARMARGEKLAGIFQTPAGEEALTRLWRAAYAGEPVREEIQVGRRGGAERVDATLSRVQDAARGPQGVVLVLRDNTERIRTQAELRQTRAQIRSLTDQLNNNTPSGDGAPAAS